MKLLRRKLNHKGFSHVELFLLLAVILVISGVGYYVYRHNTSKANSTYTRLANIDFGGLTFKELACRTHVDSKNSKIIAYITVGRPAGPGVSPSYNPLALYRINTMPPILQPHDKWHPGSTSYITFSLPTELNTRTFNLGIEGYLNYKLTFAWGTTNGKNYKVGSIPLCNPVTPPPPIISITASPTTVKSGGSAKLTWTTVPNSSICTALGNWSGGKATSGTQSTGALKVSSTYTLTCSDASGVTTESVTVSVATVGPGVACAGNPATTGSTLNGANYPLIHTTVFKGSSFPTNLQSYGTGSASPYGYYEQSHLVMTGNYLAIKGYPDSSSGYGGDVTAGFDLSNQVPSSGGFDVCMTLSTGSWQNGKYQVNMVGNSWPADNSWGEGENDFFEGSPASAGINIHGIGCGNSCGTAVYHAEWPSVSISDGQPHLYSARWDPVHGYTFFLDGTSFNYQGNLVQSNYTTPTTPHHLSLQMQDSCNCNSVPVEADIYWAAAYGYN